MNLNKKGFSLVEVLVTISIIGIISVVAIPTYNSYMLRSKIEAIISSISGAKFTIQNNYLNNNKSFDTLSYASDATSFTKPRSNFMDSITITNGIILVRGNSQQLSGKQIDLTFSPSVENDGSITWTCTTNEEFYEYVPSECRN